MAIAGMTVLGLGVAVSLFGFVHDYRAERIRNKEPQAAPKRFLLEAHFLAAALSGAGAGMAWAWWIGLLAAAFHAVLAVAITHLIQRVA